MNSASKSLKKVPFKDIVPKYQNFFFDCDGVLYNGKNYLPKAFETLNKLSELKKNIFLVTNASQHTRDQLLEKVKAGGYQPDKEKLFTSSFLTAKYLKINYPEVKKAYVIGSPGIVKELELQGIAAAGSIYDKEKKMDPSLFDKLEVDEDIKAVVVGIDPDINFYKICYASVLIQRGALFIATNSDSNVKMQKYKMPGGGSMLKSIEYAVEKSAHIVGKPNPDVIDIAKKIFDIKLEESIMVGDRLDSDILLGKTASIDTFAVLTGVTSEEKLKNECEKEEDGIVPTYYWERLEM